tara:strand:+ start:1155 stop:2429 length:1275 start_codon:yes stop_codon:yes gene_type:complete
MEKDNEPIVMVEAKTEGEHLHARTVTFSVPLSHVEDYEEGSNAYLEAVYSWYSSHYKREGEQSYTFLREIYRSPKKKRAARKSPKPDTGETVPVRLRVDGITFCTHVPVGTFMKWQEEPTRKRRINALLSELEPMFPPWGTSSSRTLLSIGKKEYSEECDSVEIKVENHGGGVVWVPSEVPSDVTDAGLEKYLAWYTDVLDHAWLSPDAERVREHNRVSVWSRALWNSNKPILDKKNWVEHSLCARLIKEAESEPTYELRRAKIAESLGLDPSETFICVGYAPDTDMELIEVEAHSKRTGLPVVIVTYVPQKVSENLREAVSYIRLSSNDVDDLTFFVRMRNKVKSQPYFPWYRTKVRSAWGPQRQTRSCLPNYVMHRAHQEPNLALFLLAKNENIFADRSVQLLEIVGIDASLSRELFESYDI